MRLAWLVLFSGLFGLAAAWTKEDYEIFDLVSALEAEEGKGTTFYSLLNIEPGASQAVITKAYRKKSLEMHPDKNPGVRNIHDRFARLGVITAILRSPEGRERYNHFYKNGVPKWRGTGYYYSRYRPTLLHTLIFIAFLSSLAHLLVMRLNYNRDRRRVEYFERSALAAAGSSQKQQKQSENGIGAVAEKKAASVRRRKVKVPMVEGNEGAGVLDLVVEGDQVYLPHEDGTETPLSDLAIPPGLSRVWPARLALLLLRKGLAFLPPNLQARAPIALRPLGSVEANGAVSDEDDDDAPADDTPTPTPGPRRNRLSQLKRQKRLQGKSSGTSSPADSATTTEAELESDEDSAAAEEKRKKKSLGKAGGARRRKMAMKR